jgi:hypothetical protein
MVNGKLLSPVYRNENRSISEKSMTYKPEKLDDSGLYILVIWDLPEIN